MRHKSLTRVLALDLHPRHFGFVVVEVPDRLLEWGVRSCRHRGNSNEALVRRGLRPLLELWQPSVVVVQSPSRLTPRANSRNRRLLSLIATEAKNHRVSVRIGPKRARVLTKHENARLLAEQYPVLAWNLHSKRKPWESEDYRMSMFAAAAAAMTFFSPEGRPPAMRGSN
jgi:hypothetical protein